MKQGEDLFLDRLLWVLLPSQPKIFTSFLNMEFATQRTSTTPSERRWLNGFTNKQANVVGCTKSLCALHHASMLPYRRTV
jgi:hypothetical protein